MFDDEEEWIKNEIDAALADLPHEASEPPSPSHDHESSPLSLWASTEAAEADGASHFHYDYPVHFDGEGATAEKWALPAFQEFVSYTEGEEARCRELEEAIGDLYRLRDEVTVPERLDVFIQPTDEMMPLALDEFGVDEDQDEEQDDNDDENSGGSDDEDEALNDLVETALLRCRRHPAPKGFAPEGQVEAQADAPIEDQGQCGSESALPAAPTEKGQDDEQQNPSAGPAVVSETVGESPQGAEGASATAGDHVSQGAKQDGDGPGDETGAPDFEEQQRLAQHRAKEDRSRVAANIDRARAERKQREEEERRKVQEDEKREAWESAERQRLKEQRRLEKEQARQQRKALYAQQKEQEREERARRKEQVQAEFQQRFDQAKKHEEVTRQGLAEERKAREQKQDAIRIAVSELKEHTAAFEKEFAALEEQLEAEVQQQEQNLRGMIDRRTTLDARRRWRQQMEAREAGVMAAVDAAAQRAAQARVRSLHEAVRRRAALAGRRQWREVRENWEEYYMEAEDQRSVEREAVEADRAAMARLAEEHARQETRRQQLRARAAARQRREAEERRWMGTAHAESDRLDEAYRAALRGQRQELEDCAASEARARAGVHGDRSAAWQTLQQELERGCERVRRAHEALQQHLVKQQQVRQDLESAETRARDSLGTEEQQAVQQKLEEFEERLQRLQAARQHSLYDALQRQLEAHEKSAAAEYQRWKKARDAEQQEYLEAHRKWQEAQLAHLAQEDAAFASRLHLWALPDSTEAVHLQLQLRSDWARFVDAAAVRALVRRASVRRPSTSEPPGPGRASDGDAELPGDGGVPGVAKAVLDSPEGADAVLDEALLQRLYPGLAPADLAVVDASVEGLTAIAPLPSACNLECLLVPSNHVAAVPQGLGLSVCAKLQVLNLQDNWLASLAFLRPPPGAGPSANTTLQVLNVAMNKLDDIAGLEACAGLRTFDCSNNCIVSLEPLRHCTALTKLEAYRNNLLDLATLTHLTTLVSFAGGRNAITDISGCFRASLTLQNLFLYNNQIQEVPTRMHNVMLQQLWLNDNALTKFPTVSFTPLLSHLQLHSNRIADISGLSSCLQLEFLDLSFNCIADPTQLWHLQSCRRLQSLALNDNPVTTFSATLSEAERHAQVRHQRDTLVLMLPALRELDNSDVTKDERRDAHARALRGPTHRHLLTFRQLCRDLDMSVPEVAFMPGAGGPAPLFGPILRAGPTYPCAGPNPLRCALPDAAWTGRTFDFLCTAQLRAQTALRAQQKTALQRVHAAPQGDGLGLAANASSQAQAHAQFLELRQAEATVRLLTSHTEEHLDWTAARHQNVFRTSTDYAQRLQAFQAKEARARLAEWLTGRVRIRRARAERVRRLAARWEAMRAQYAAACARIQPVWRGALLRARLRRARFEDDDPETYAPVDLEFGEGRFLGQTISGVLAQAMAEYVPGQTPPSPLSPSGAYQPHPPAPQSARGEPTGGGGAGDPDSGGADQDVGVKAWLLAQEGSSEFGGSTAGAEAKKQQVASEWGSVADTIKNMHKKRQNQARKVAMRERLLPPEKRLDALHRKLERSLGPPGAAPAKPARRLPHECPSPLQHAAGPKGPGTPSGGPGTPPGPVPAGDLDLQSVSSAGSIGQVRSSAGSMGGPLDESVALGSRPLVLPAGGLGAATGTGTGTGTGSGSGTPPGASQWALPWAQVGSPQSPYSNPPSGGRPHSFPATPTALGSAPASGSAPPGAGPPAERNSSSAPGLWQPKPGGLPQPVDMRDGDVLGLQSRRLMGATQGGSAPNPALGKSKPKPQPPVLGHRGRMDEGDFGLMSRRLVGAGQGEPQVNPKPPQRNPRNSGQPAFMKRPVV